MLDKTHPYLSRSEEFRDEFEKAYFGAQRGDSRGLQGGLGSRWHVHPRRDLPGRGPAFRGPGGDAVGPAVVGHSALHGPLVRVPGPARSRPLQGAQ